MEDSIHYSIDRLTSKIYNKEGSLYFAFIEKQAFFPAFIILGSISKENFFKYHTVLHDIVKGKLASAKLPPIAECICADFNDQLNAVTDGKNHITCLFGYCKGRTS